jgi:hypothetical protein
VAAAAVVALVIVDADEHTARGADDGARSLPAKHSVDNTFMEIPNPKFQAPNPNVRDGLGFGIWVLGVGI